MNSYSYLSQYYDSLTGNVDYNRRADFVVSIFTNSGISMLDAGCGTGLLSRLLLDRGYDMIGVDNSIEMLSIAQERNPEQLLLLQDLTELDLFGTVQGIICFQDTLNHLNTLSDVQRCISRFSLFLEKDCYLILDINTLYKHEIVLGNNSLIIENDDIFCAWRNDYNTFDHSIRMQLDLFSNTNNEKYNRSTEYIREIYIPDDWLAHTLEDNGFIVMDKLDGDDYTPVHSRTQRLLFVVRKDK